jgi:CRISPR-associated protein Cmr2
MMNGGQRPEADWETLLLSWMHDPADKALDIRTHVSRAARYASVILEREVTTEELKQAAGDSMASALERVPMMKATEVAIGPERGNLEIRHLLSGETQNLYFDPGRPDLTEAYRKSVQGCQTLKQKYLALWRNLPENAAAVNASYRRIPAETRNPDHSIWEHLDTTTAIGLTERGGKGKLALLRYQLNPVQRFIEAARGIADLMNGSYLLSDLCFAGMTPVLERCGPTAFVFPALRGLGRMDLWLKQQGVPIEVSGQDLQQAAIPNRYLAIVPAAWAAELERETVAATQAHWTAIGEAVRRKLKQKLGANFAGWDRDWDAQMQSYFDVRCVSFSLQELDTKLVRPQGDEVGLLEMQKASQYANSGRSGLWQVAVEYSAALMEAERLSAHTPAYRATAPVGEKCTLLGSYEQVGPGKRKDAKEFWETLHQLDGKDEDAGRESDRLCAISLVKRRAMRDYYESAYGVPRAELVDTRKMAQRSRRPENSTYYGIVHMDGDEMGKWLSGEKSPPVRKVLAQAAVQWFEQKGCQGDLERRRPVSPALHAAISSGLNHYSAKVVPEIVKEHRGVLIYAGGDDVLAAVPIDLLLECGVALRKAFSSAEVLGRAASTSAGLVVAHMNEDLRFVLAKAKEAERRAKDGGRDRFTLSILRRNGEHATSTAKWEWADALIGMRNKFFAPECTDRWTYQLAQQMRILRGLPEEAFERELSRQLKRSDSRDQSFVEDWKLFQQKANVKHEMAIEEFLRFAQSASFLTRARDAKED